MTIGDHTDGGRPTVLEASTQPRALPPLGLDPSAIDALEVGGESWGSATVADLFDRHDGLGLVVTHRGALAYERYGAAAAADRRNLNFSVTKSFTGTLAAMSTARGRLPRTGVVGDLLPELAATGFADATVADIADMTAAIAYDEDYDEADAPSHRAGWRGFGDYMVAIGLDDAGAGDAPDSRPRTVRDLLAVIGSVDRPHGDTFAYATPVSDVLGWLLERIHDRDGGELLVALWASIRTEHDAQLGRDPAGTALMGAGLAMSTRDLARFGLLLNDAISETGPTDGFDARALDAIRDGGDPEAFRRGGHYGYLGGYTYRDQWWLPGGPSRPLSAWGIYGQVLWIDPDADVVIAYHCGGPLPSDERRDLEQDAMCRAIVEASSTWA
jgi:CubicO group peptidase (beta-lactamase class C family)